MPVKDIRVMWYTPQVYIDAARAVMGDIDLDPATDERVQKRIQARRYYTVHTNGLDKDWYGRVWINSPYEPKLLEFVEKAISEWQSRRVTQMIFLTHTSETWQNWFQNLGQHCNAICLHRDRIRWAGDHTGVFTDNNGAEQEAHFSDLDQPLDAEYSVHGSVFFYFGPDDKMFKKVFARFGFVK